MLCVTMIDGVLTRQLAHQVLDADRGDRVERAARLVHQDHLRPHGDAAGDAQALLLAAGEVDGRRAELVAHLVPEPGPPAAPTRSISESSLPPCAQQPRADADVVPDRHRRERIRPLEHHADALAHVARDPRRGRRCPAPSTQHPALDARVLDDLVHAIDAAQQRRLAAAGRPDDRGDLRSPGTSGVTSRTPACVPYHAVRCSTLHRWRAGSRPAPPASCRWRVELATSTCVIATASAGSAGADTLITSTIITEHEATPAHACSCWYSYGPVAYVKMRSGSASIGRKMSVL